MIDLDFELPSVEVVKPMKKSNKKWSEPKPVKVEQKPFPLPGAGNSISQMHPF